jgi:hypothetical protein
LHTVLLDLSLEDGNLCVQLKIDLGMLCLM